MRIFSFQSFEENDSTIDSFCAHFLQMWDRQRETSQGATNASGTKPCVLRKKRKNSFMKRQNIENREFGSHGKRRWYSERVLIDQQRTCAALRSTNRNASTSKISVSLLDTCVLIEALRYEAESTIYKLKAIKEKRSLKLNLRISNASNLEF